jgi:transposase
VQIVIANIETVKVELQEWLAGLDHSTYQSGETDVTGGITRVGDESVGAALYEAADELLSRVTRFSALKRWGMDIAKRRGAPTPKRRRPIGRLCRRPQHRRHLPLYFNHI